MDKFTIKVPASSANIGPGFDSAGIALTKYLTLHVEKSESWNIQHHSVHLPPAPKNLEEHLIYQAALHTAKAYNTTLPACHIIMESEIPLARGLGSSASAIIAGIGIANSLCNLSLTKKEILTLATDMEGHPDNVAAALYGGLIVSALITNGDIEVFQTVNEDIEFVVSIPNFELKTEDARKVLPHQFSRTEAAQASAVGNVMIASLISGDYELAGKLMEADFFHEPYRASLIQNYQQIRQEAKAAGAYGTVISGAGPTMLSLVKKGKGADIAARLQSLYPDYSIETLKMDLCGLYIQQ